MQKFNNKISKILKLPATLFILLMAVYFSFGLNVTLSRDIYVIIKNLENVPTGFVISIPFFFIAAFNLLFIPFSFKGFIKPFFIFLVLLSSAVSYVMYKYGIVFSKGMIENIVDTDYNESMSYFNVASFTWVLFFGVIPSFIIYKIEITRSSVKREVLYNVSSILISLWVIGVVASLYSVNYLSIARNNEDLRKSIVPTHFVRSAYKYVKETYFNEPIPYKYVALDAVKTPTSSRDKKDLMVLVVGETARSMNYQLNGYAKETNKYTSSMGVTSFKHVSSCGTATAVSVPCMFSILPKKDFSKHKAKNTENLLDIAKRVGVNVLWLENNSTCKGVCKNIETIDIRDSQKKSDKYCEGHTCLDEALLIELENRIKTAQETDNLIVLHIMGSHGPTYYKRYPETHKRFTPDCAKSDIQNCTTEEITNSYDNTILYTDYILSKVIKLLKEQGDNWNTSMVYVSDHGESLGEKGLYLHGMPYSIAPDEQTKVPYISWFSDNFIKNKGIKTACLEKASDQGAYSHDNFFHSILGLMDIKTKAYTPALDMFSACRENLKTRVVSK